MENTPNFILQGLSNMKPRYLLKYCDNPKYFDIPDHIQKYSGEVIKELNKPASKKGWS